MPTQVTDLIGTLLNLRQLKLQEQAQRLQAAGQQSGALAQFYTIARQTGDPAAQSALAEQFSRLTGQPASALLESLQHLAPTEESLRALTGYQGARAAEGQQTGDAPEYGKQAAEAFRVIATGETGQQQAEGGLQQDMIANIRQAMSSMPDLKDRLTIGYATSHLTGMDPLQLAITTQPLGAPELEQGAGIKAGTRLSAEGNANLQAAQAQNRLGWGQLAAGSAYQMGELQIGGLNAARELAAQNEKNFNPLHIAQGLSQLESHLQSLRNKGQPSKAELEAIAATMNTYYRQLREHHYNAPADVKDPESLLAPSLWRDATQGIGSWMQQFYNPRTGGPQ